MVTTTRWDVAEHLGSEEAIAAYIDAAREDGDHELIKAAISDVARKRVMTDIAAKAGLSRAGLSKALGRG